MTPALRWTAMRAREAWRHIYPARNPVVCNSERWAVCHSHWPRFRDPRQKHAALLSHSLSRASPFHCHDVIWKQPINVRNLKSLSLSVFFFALAHERVFIKKHNTECGFALGAENILTEGVCVHFSARKLLRLGQWKGYGNLRREPVAVRVLPYSR